MGGGGKGKGGPPPPPSSADAAKARAELQQRQREKMEEEKRAAQEAIARAKELEASKRDLQARLSTLQSHDIGHVPWDTALLGLHLVGGKGTTGGGGVDVVELPGGAAVCVRQGTSIITESIVDALAALLGVRVACMRLVQAGSDEGCVIRDMTMKWQSIKISGQELEKMIAKLPPADQEKARESWGQAINRPVPYAVVEFVPGSALDTAASSLEVASPDLLADLGHLCALDLLINNMDRVPLPCWSNTGNLTNVMVTPVGRLIGIDQQVNQIDVGPGLDAYLSEVRDLSAQVLRGSSPAIAASISAAILQNCGVQLSDSSLQHVIEGMGTIFRKVVLEAREGRLAETLALAAARAGETKFDFDGFYGHIVPIDSADVAAKDVNFVLQVVEVVATSAREIEALPSLAQSEP